MKNNQIDIIITTRGITFSVINLIAKLGCKHPYHLKVHREVKNNSDFNLSRIWNFYIKNSLCKYVLLLNDDVMPEHNCAKDWLTRLVEVFSLDDNIAVVGPSTNNIKSAQEVSYEYACSYLYKPLKKVIEDTQLSGFCYLLRKDIILKIGGFNENIPFYGNESNLNKRLLKKGYRLVWRKDVFVYHRDLPCRKKDQYIMINNSL